MITEIKWKESIGVNRLIYKSASFKSNSNGSIGKILVVVAFVLALMLLIGGQWTEGVGGIVFVLFVGIFFYILFSERSRHSLALTRVSGISPEENRKILYKIPNDLRWTTMEDKKNYPICLPTPSFLSSKHQINTLRWQ